MENLWPKAVVSLTPTSKTRAHAAHAPLRRLSEAALSACSEAELLAAFAAEARSALKIDGVELIAPAWSRLRSLPAPRKSSPPRAR